MNLFEYTYDIVRQIPDGYISSYGAIADALGDKIAARAVGRMMNQNTNADTMPTATMLPYILSPNFLPMSANGAPIIIKSERFDKSISLILIPPES